MIKLGSTRCLGSVTDSLCLFVSLAFVTIAAFAFGAGATSVQAATVDPSASAPVGAQTGRTRFIIALPKQTQFHVSTLTNPNRVVVEFNATKFLLPRLPQNGPVGLVSGFSGGKAGNGKSRVIIQVTEPVIVDQSQIVRAAAGGHELQLEFIPVPAAPVNVAGRKKLEQKFGRPKALGAGMLAQPPLPRPAESPSVRAAKTYRPIIVIDPGHGGRDSGAKKHGVVEKEVVLEFSHILRKKLEATGRYKVLMTRETDEFISLDGRRAFAEKMGAELFIAVHADYARSSARGATVYSLREKVANRLKRKTMKKTSKSIGSADLEANASGDLGAVKRILGDLFQREVQRTNIRTDVVSRSLVKFMGGATNLRKNPHKEAAFRVLKTAHFPSVLVELAFVSNRSDAKLLTSDKWRKKVAKSMVQAVDRYFSTQIARLPL